MQNMYNSFQLARKFLIYLLTSSNGKGHGVHSPFVFDFIVHVLRGKQVDVQGFRQIEAKRRELEHSSRVLDVLDLGAGSSFDKKSQRTVSSIAKRAAKPSRFARLFYRIIRYYQIDSVLELGTSLGLTTRYLSIAGPRHGVISIEGAPAIADFTAKSLAEEGIRNTTILTGDFKDHLPGALASIKGSKLVFFDGNHQYQPTLDYFQAALGGIGDEDILIFDDIHWSNDMEKAWAEIRNNEKVSCTIDLFFIGIVFFRKEFKEKLDFSIGF
jgi:predicted O-methyltransferase YrrM